MFSRIMTKKSINDIYAQIDKIVEKIENADSVIIGAGAGLSTSAGYEYSGDRFEKYFGDYRKKYGFDNMYSGGFYPYDTLEEFWAYWSKYIYYNRYVKPSKNVYDTLLDIVKDKDYFVITTNVDHCFQRAGFDKKRLFYTQGDYGLLQCSTPCHNKTYDNKEIIEKMMSSQSDMKIPSELVPKCPVCGKPMTTNLRCDDSFVQDEGWYKASDRYSDFIRRHHGLKNVYIELGVGGNTPVIIKYPFWQMTAKNKNATYVCINYGEAVCPDEIANQSICINSDIGKVLDIIKNKLQ